MTGYKGFYLANKVGRYKAFSLPKLYTLSVGLSLWEAFPLNNAPLFDRSLTRNGLLHWVSLTPTFVPLGSVNKLRDMFIWLGLVMGGGVEYKSHLLEEGVQDNKGFAKRHE